MDICFGNNIILPGEPGWFIPKSEKFYIIAMAMAGPDAFVFSATLDGEFHEMTENYARFYRCDAGRWLCVEVEAAITDLLVLRPPEQGGEGLVVLGQQGEVWFVGDETRTEQMPAPPSDDINYMTCLRHTAGTLFAGGLGGACYRRQGTSWVSDDEGIRGFEAPLPRKRPGDFGVAAALNDIATLPNGDQYACGRITTARPALFWRPGGTGRWQWLGYAVDDPAYDFLVPRRILVEPPGTVWVTTNKGVLVRGNAAQGFRIATSVAYDTPQDGSARVRAAFGSAVFYNGALYVGSNVGPFRLRSDGGWDAVGPQRPPAPGCPFDASGKLQVSGGVLWAFGNRTVARHDGQLWHPVPIPPLYKDDAP